MRGSAGRSGRIIPAAQVACALACGIFVATGFASLMAAVAAVAHPGAAGFLPAIAGAVGTAASAAGLIRFAPWCQHVMRAGDTGYDGGGDRDIAGDPRRRERIGTDGGA